MTPKETHEWLRGTAYITYDSKSGVAPFPLDTAQELVRLARVGLQVEDAQFKRANRSVTEGTADSYEDRMLGEIRALKELVEKQAAVDITQETDKVWAHLVETKLGGVEPAARNEIELRLHALQFSHGNLDTAVAMLAFLKGEEQKGVSPEVSVAQVLKFYDIPEELHSRIITGLAGAGYQTTP